MNKIFYYYKILVKNKIPHYIVKIKRENKYVIHIAFLKNYDNVVKLKKRLQQLGLNYIIVKKIEKK